MNRIASLLPATLLLTAACSSQSTLPTDIDSVDQGKADGVTAQVEWSDTNEPLFSNSLRSQICGRIGSQAAGAACDDFDMTVVKVGKSTLIQYIEDQRPVTMALHVVAENTATNDLFNAVLTRQLNSQFAFSFEIDLSSSLDEAHLLIEDMADEGGEFPDFFEWIGDGRAKAIDFDDLPANIQDIFESTLEEHIDGIQGIGHTASAEIDGDPPVIELIHDGELIGYALSIFDSIDHPLWDGSGSTYYFDKNGTEIDVVDWAG